MKTLGAFEVKTHLSRILDEIEEKKETIAITRHGRAIALLIPVGEDNSVAKAIESIHQNRKGVRLGEELSIKALRNEGRK